MPRFSILMPTMGKRKEYLLRAVNSILSQDFTDFELIIKSGGEDVSDILPPDPRIKFLLKPDTGISQSINQAIEIATGEILNESNDDDEMLPGTLSLVNAEIGDYQWLYGKIKVGNGEAGEPFDYQRLLSANFIPQPAVFWKRSAGEKIGLWDESVPLAADYEYWLRLGNSWKPKYIDRPLALYNLHPEQATRTQFREQQSDAQIIRGRYL